MNAVLLPENDFDLSVAEESDLDEILDLNKKNYSDNVVWEDRQDQWFVTATFDKNILRKIMKDIPILIVRCDWDFAWYLIWAVPSVAPEVDLYSTYPTLLKDVYFDGKSLNKYNFFVIIQIAIVKKYRWRKLTYFLYKKMYEKTKNNYELMVSDIADENKRSLGAHLNKIGFEKIKKFHLDDDLWYVVVLDIRSWSRFEKNILLS